MKKVLLALVLVASLAVSANAGTWALYGVSVPAPEENDTYDNAVGIEGQYRIPLTDGVDIGLILGLSRWEADTYRWASCMCNAKVSGDVTDFTVGLAAIWEIPVDLPEPFTLSLEGNIKRHILSSDVDVDVHSYWLPPLSNELDYDDLTTVGCSLDLEAELEDNISAIVGCGYQWDLQSHEDVKIAGFKTPLKNGLEGLVFRAGILIRTP